MIYRVPQVLSWGELFPQRTVYFTLHILRDMKIPLPLLCFFNGAFLSTLIQTYLIHSTESRFYLLVVFELYLHKYSGILNSELRNIAVE
jgi:hypothetical protein